ncbi:MAG: polyprenyl synthetase family protein, partial [Planctomycetota bacterium]|nr:polyprenyl synthetase family protein [Planctomycetota bacterium]
MEHYLERKRKLVNLALYKYLTPVCFPKSLHHAMRYSVLNGGKRLRAILALMVGEVFTTPPERIMPYACALEIVHSYSLVHDDLPAMDDDDFRRGKPTCHKVFGEAMAILSGDALLTRAFQIIAEKITNKAIAPKLISELSRAIGSLGMVGGQVLDIQN